ncbi:hypothetical protein JXJ21_09620 [candidate division KSB1 bacterium]|nr:hypothetical protein [candidate division KSB1 bacterium]
MEEKQPRRVAFEILLWFIAFVITVSSAIYQRLTGPTYPIRGKIELNQKIYKYKLHRTHGGLEDHQVKLEIPDTSVTGELVYKLYYPRKKQFLSSVKSMFSDSSSRMSLKMDSLWTTLPMRRVDSALVADLPHQDPAGKIMYKVILKTQNQTATLPGDEPVIIRFKGAVPNFILYPHILLMFLAMLVSNRAGMEALRKNRNPRLFALWATALLFIGGMILGPVMQEFAFGEFWTGFPFGYDLTDNKTLIAMIGWIIAVYAGRRDKPAHRWVLAASILLFIIYLIPHSVLGSELDYSQMPAPGK